MSRDRWWTEREATLDSSLDIDSALDAFDRSPWKERVNKILIQDNPYPIEFVPGDPGPLNRFR